MALSINRVQLAGNLTRDPQIRVIGENRSVASFGLAINRRYKTAEGEAKEEVTFVDIDAWGRTAELAGQYLTKGSPCYIEGRLRLETWQDKEGQNRQRLKVVADHIQFLNRNRDQDMDSTDTADEGANPPSATIRTPQAGNGGKTAAGTGVARSVPRRSMVGSASNDTPPF